MPRPWDSISVCSTLHLASASAALNVRRGTNSELQEWLAALGGVACSKRSKYVQIQRGETRVKY